MDHLPSEKLPRDQFLAERAWRVTRDIWGLRWPFLVLLVYFLVGLWGGLRSGSP
jgi:hypothetical protein